MSLSSHGSQGQRQLQAAETIKRTLAAYLLRNELLDLKESKEPFPAPHLITITEVRLSPDLQHALIFVMPLGGEKPEAAAAFLNQNSKKLRMYLGQQIQARVTPSLKFTVDESLQKADRIESLLRKVNKSQE